VALLPAAVAARALAAAAAGARLSSATYRRLNLGLVRSYSYIANAPL
jgi:hypothetical protein